MSDSDHNVRTLFEESVAVKQAMLSGGQLNILPQMARQIAESIASGGKLMLCGNGGSAADAQHLAAELLIRLRPEVSRNGIPAIALSMDTSTMTACGNDFSYEVLYERMVTVLGKPGDVLLGITTSGRSVNVNRALKAARDSNIMTCAFLGGNGGEALAFCDFAMVVPSRVTGRVQEAHITAGHALMELVEERLLENGFLATIEKSV